MYLSLPLREFPLEFLTAVALTKTGVIPDGEKSLTICAFVSIQHHSVTDRQTDRQTDGFAISRSACIGMLTRYKNYNVNPKVRN